MCRMARMRERLRVPVPRTRKKRAPVPVVRGPVPRMRRSRCCILRSYRTLLSCSCCFYRHSGPLGPAAEFWAARCYPPVHPAHPGHPASDAEKARRGTGPRPTRKNRAGSCSARACPSPTFSCLKQDFQDFQDVQDEAAGTRREGLEVLHVYRLKKTKLSYFA